jgi:hypothetical protein
MNILRVNTAPHGLFITDQEVYACLLGVAFEVMVLFLVTLIDESNHTIK